MYNGIGLETARGSGTNGYVQRNMSFIRRHKDNVDYKSEEELKKLDSQLNRGPSREILDHERKRKVELKCMEMQELMEEQGYSDEEITRKVSVYRQMLMDNLQNSTTGGSVVEKDELGRPVAKETHQIAEASQARNEHLRAAFGLSEFFKDGSSLDPQRKDKEKAAEELAAVQKKYAMVPDESSPSPSPSPERKKKRKERAKMDKSGEDQRENKKRRKHGNAESPPVEKKKKKRSSSSPSHERDKDEQRGTLEPLSSAEKNRASSISPERQSRSASPAQQKTHRRRHKSHDETSRQEQTTELRQRHRSPSQSRSPDDRKTRRKHERTRTQRRGKDPDTSPMEGTRRHVDSPSPHRKHKSARSYSPPVKKKRRDSAGSQSPSPDRRTHHATHHNTSKQSSRQSPARSRHHHKRRDRDELDSVD